MSWLDRINPQLHHIWSGPWAPGFVEPLRVLYDHELVMFAEGACEVRVGDETIPCPAGTFIIIPPGRLHLSHGGARRAVRHCCHFDWTHAAPRVGENMWAFWPERPEPKRVHRAPGFVPAGIMHGVIRDMRLVMSLAQTLVHRWRSVRAHERAAIRATLLELLIALLSSQEGEPRRRDVAAELAMKARDALDRVDLSSTGVRASLEELGHSYEHVLRVFKSAFGITPLRYVNASRMERAKLLLQRHDAAISSVARELGFADPGYFIRAFKKYAGVTPGEYARGRA